MKMQSLTGWSFKKTKNVECLPMKKYMHKIKEQSSITNGVSSTFAILLISAMTFLSGCTITPVHKQGKSPIVLSVDDLNYFQIDCKHKKEQVELLQGQRHTKAEFANSIDGLLFIALNSRSSNALNEKFQSIERRNWLVDQQLLNLRNLCYSKEYYE